MQQVLYNETKKYITHVFISYVYSLITSLLEPQVIIKWCLQYIHSRIHRTWIPWLYIHLHHPPWRRIRKINKILPFPRNSLQLPRTPLSWHHKVIIYVSSFSRCHLNSKLFRDVYKQGKKIINPSFTSYSFLVASESKPQFLSFLILYELIWKFTLF